jgi:hypothetical protein
MYLKSYRRIKLGGRNFILLHVDGPQAADHVEAKVLGFLFGERLKIGNVFEEAREGSAGESLGRLVGPGGRVEEEFSCSVTFARDDGHHAKLV